MLPRAVCSEQVNMKQKFHEKELLKVEKEKKSLKLYIYLTLSQKIYYQKIKILWLPKTYLSTGTIWAVLIRLDL